MGMIGLAAVFLFVAALAMTLGLSGTVAAATSLGGILILLTLVFALLLVLSGRQSIS